MGGAVVAFPFRLAFSPHHAALVLTMCRAPMRGGGVSGRARGCLYGAGEVEAPLPVRPQWRAVALAFARHTNAALPNQNSFDWPL
jgi:hypothetical protein